MSEPKTPPPVRGFGFPKEKEDIEDTDAARFKRNSFSFGEEGLEAREIEESLLGRVASDDHGLSGSSDIGVAAPDNRPSD